MFSKENFRRITSIIEIQNCVVISQNIRMIDTFVETLNDRIDD